MEGKEKSPDRIYDQGIFKTSLTPWKHLGFLRRFPGGNDYFSITIFLDEVNPSALIW